MTRLVRSTGGLGVRLVLALAIAWGCEVLLARYLMHADLLVSLTQSKPAPAIAVVAVIALRGLLLVVLPALALRALLAKLAAALSSR